MRQMRSILFVAYLLSSPFLVGGQKPSDLPNPPNPAPSNLNTMVESAPVKFNPGTRRDPFLNPLLFKKPVEDSLEEVFKGKPPAGIRGMFIAQVQLLGVSLREAGKTAIFQGTDKRAYFLREGDRLFDGFVKSIEPDSVLLIRESRMRSGEVRTQEFWKRLRTP